MQAGLLDCAGDTQGCPGLSLPSESKRALCEPPGGRFQSWLIRHPHHTVTQVGKSAPGVHP